MKKYIILGGGGYLGYVVVLELLKRGYHPIEVVVLPSEKHPALLELNVKVTYGNILDKAFLTKLITPGSVVFHLAGIVDIGSPKNDLIYEVNVIGTKNVVDIAILNKVEKLIYTSSVHTIVPLPNGQLMSEPNTFVSEQLVGDYAKSKAMATADIFEKAKDLNVVVLYPSGIIGPYDYHMSHFGQVIIDYTNRKLKAYLKGGYNFVDVRDVADGIVNAYERGISGEGYILSGEYISLKQLFQILNEKLGRKKLPIKLASWFIKMLMPFAEMHYRIRKKKPIISSYSLYTLNVNSNFSNQKAKDELGFNPRPIRESLFDMLDWFIENKPDFFYPKHRVKNKKKGEDKIVKHLK